MDYTPLKHINLDKLLGETGHFYEIASIKGLVAIGYSSELIIDRVKTGELHIILRNHPGENYLRDHPNKKLYEHELKCIAYYNTKKDEDGYEIMDQGVFKLKFFKPDSSTDSSTDRKQEYIPLLNPFWTKWVIIDKDENNKWFVISSKFCKCTWILSKDPEIDQDVFFNIRNNLKQKRFAVQKLKLYD